MRIGMRTWRGSRVHTFAEALFAALVLVSSGCTTTDKRSAGAGSPPSIESDAFVWGYPLVVTQRTLETFARLIGVNKLFNQSVLSTAAIRVVVAPNQDTLYSVAVVDLRSEPMVLTVPDVTDRYWTYQFLDGWTNSFHYIGTRATSGKGGSFAMVPPGYSGTLPPGVTRVDSPTRLMFLLGRYVVRDNADAPNVTALVRTLTPLSQLTGAAAPPPPPPLPAPPGAPNLTGTSGAAFFDELGDALALNGPANAEDQAAATRFRALGIGPGLHPTSSADAGSLPLLESGARDGFLRLDSTLADRAVEQNGWRTFLHIGLYTDDFPLRATVAKYAWGANVPEEAIYPISLSDASGQPYDGAKNYVMHFDEAALPPVDPTHGFWSLTLYGTDMFFVENSIQRYAIGDRTSGLAYNGDGSLDLYIQSTAPVGHEGNWLPSPAPRSGGGDAGAAPGFRLALRLYLPTQAVRDGKYVVPRVSIRP